MRSPTRLSRLWYCDEFLATDPDDRTIDQVQFSCWKKIGMSDSKADFEFCVYKVTDVIGIDLPEQP